MTKKDIVREGIISKNPVFVLILGLCPTLAVTTSLENALGMGISALFVLMLSNTLISSIKGFVPDRVRIPVFIVIIATFVTIASMLLEAYLPDLFGRLGIYIPLIVVNCIILARADSYARKNSVPDSFIDGAAMGLGFTAALVIIGSIREILGTSELSFFGTTLLSLGTPEVVLMILPPGALLTIGLIIAALNYWKHRGVAR